MEYLFEKFQLNTEPLRNEAVQILLKLHTHRDYGDNTSKILIGDPKKPDEYSNGLEILQQNQVIEFKKMQRREDELLYQITIINRYNFEQLFLELSTLKILPQRLLIERAIPLPRIPNLIYYEPSSGKIIINGKFNTLHKTNKKLFDALYIAHPNAASRNELLRAVGVSKRDVSQKIALNEAFSNLRKACGVKARVISLNGDGGRLNGRVYLLSAQLR